MVFAGNSALEYNDPIYAYSFVINFVESITITIGLIFLGYFLSISIHKGKYKLIAYLVYEEMDSPYEFYDLENDVEELNNLVEKDPVEFSRVREEFLDRLEDANRPYLKNKPTGK